MSHALFAFFSPGPVELAVIAGIALLLFGNRLPSIARSLGTSFTEFRRGLRAVEEDVKEEEQTART